MTAMAHLPEVVSREEWLRARKELLAEEYQGNDQPIRSRYAASFAYGALVTAASEVLRTWSCRRLPIWSAAEEQLGQPVSRGCSVPSASRSKVHMK
jgi:hypothetical protein